MSVMRPVYKFQSMMNNDSYLAIHELGSSMIERIHLQIILALHQYKTLTAAASALNLSQSALSHQIKHLEQRLGVKLWQKEGRLLRLTQPGEQLLSSAQRVIPVLQRTEQTLQAYAEGRQGNLRIGVECYPCYEWLMRVIADFLQSSPEVDVDIIQKFQFSGVEGLLNHSVDLLITPDLFEHPGLIFDSLFDYELVLILAKDHPLANEAYCKPEMLRDQTLILFPVPVERLDIYTEFLIPAHVTPKAQKFTESIEMMLQLTVCQRGVFTLPRWLAKIYCEKYPLTTLTLGEKGVFKTLYAAYKQSDGETPYLHAFLALGKQKQL